MSGIGNELTVLTNDYELVPVEYRQVITTSLALMAKREPSVQYPTRYQLERFVACQHGSDWENYKQTVAEIEIRLQAIATAHYLARVQEGQLHQWQWVARWAIRMGRLVGWFQGVAGVATAKAAFLKWQLRLAHEDILRKCEQLDILHGVLQKLEPLIAGKDREQLEANHWTQAQQSREQEEVSKSVSGYARMMWAQQMVKQELAAKAAGESNGVK